MPKRTDANHGDIVSAFRKLGWYVKSTADLGGGP